MKRFALLLLPFLLAGCVNPNGNGQSGSMSENKPSSAEIKKSTVPPNMTTANYMTEQENELKQALAETPFRVVRSNNILAIILPAETFEANGGNLSSPAQEEPLGKIADVLSRFHKTRISIIGYADGSVPQTDSRLPEERAQKVADVLKKHAKISPVRFWIEGSVLPASANETEDRPQNDHVDIILTPTFIR